MVNDVVDLAKSEGLSCLVLKLDYEKAYDCVSCDFLRYVMKKMGFRSKWISWMNAYVFMSSMGATQTTSK